MTPRPAPLSCQHEPPYPAHATVVFSIRAPELTAHLATERCGRQEPHPIDACGEFAP